MRRVFWLLVMLIVFSGAAVGEEEPVTLEYWLRDANLKDIEYNEVIKPFMELHPNITVNMVLLPSYDVKLRTSLAAGVIPDVYNVSVADAWDFANLGFAMNLQPLLQELDPDMYFWPIMHDLRWPNRQGDLYTFPFAWVASVTYYNKGLFKNSGVSYPTNSWDWLTLRSAAKKLTRDVDGDGKPDEWGFLAGTSHEVLDSMIYGWGGTVLDEAQRKATLDNPKSIEAIQFMMDLVHVDQVAPPLSVSGLSIVNNNLAMTVEGSYRIHGFRATPGVDWDIAMVPKSPLGRVTYGGPDGVQISRTTEHPKAAWEFVKYLVGSQRSIKGFMGGKVPINRKVATSKEWLEPELLPANKYTIIDSVDYVRGADFGTTQWWTWRSQMSTALRPALLNEQSVASAVLEANILIDNILNSVTVRAH